MKYLSSTVFFLLTLSIYSQVINKYPIIQKSNHIENYFGMQIKDSYAKLENTNDNEVIDWLTKQAEYTSNYMENISYRFNIELKLTKNSKIQYHKPIKLGKYFIVANIDNNLKTFDFYYSEEVNGMWQVLNVTKDLNVKKGEDLFLSSYEVSPDSRYIAFAFNRNGSDWKEMKIADLKTGKTLKDHLYNIKFTTISWKDDGIYYSRIDSVNEQHKYTDKVMNQRLYYHKLGNQQENDSLIFKRNDAPFNKILTNTSKDGRFLIINDFDQANEINSCYYYDFNEKGLNGIKPVARKINFYLDFMDHSGDTLIFKNGANDARGHIVGVDIKNPKKMFTLIPQLKDAIFDDAVYSDGNFYVIATQEAEEKLIIFDKQANIKKIIAFPFGTHYSFRGEDKSKQKIYFSYQSLLHPAALISLNTKTQQFDIEEQVKVNYEHQDYEIKKLWYKSDSVNVPILLMCKKGIKLDGNNPVLLEFYGGFGVSFLPSFDPGKIMFIENGGIYAFAMIRGGGELGVAWHNAGRILNKNNSINDIINAAKFLTLKKYTNSSKLAISGGSQGGLMAAAAAIRTPELFKVAIPIVGVHDMLHLEKYTIGQSTKSEYGSVKDSIQFFNLLSYSPIHNIKKSTNYPAMLIMTSDTDDRVPPMHSYKLAASLQDLKIPNILLRVEKGAGHYGAVTYDKSITELVDFYSFLFYNLGITKVN